MTINASHVSGTVSTTGDEVAALLSEFTSRLQDGEQLAIDDFAAQHPQFTEELKRLLPTARALAGLGQLDGAPEPQLSMLGDFRLLREIGRGGMGVVYEAEQVSLGRRVALKVLPFAGVLDPRQLQRFRNESRAAATLDHPHIVHVYGVGQERGVHFYAMQLIEGQSLDELVQKLRGGEGAISPHSPSGKVAGGEGANRIDSTTARFIKQSTQNGAAKRDYFRQVACWGIEAAEALDYAHQMGIVHRDVKPSNLLINSEGKLWVTDFGLAMTRAETGVTMTGDVLGTLRYMSPEQLLGQRSIIDQRTDVYSLGVTLYELLALQPAFAATDRGVLMRQVEQDDPPVGPLKQRQAPLELQTIIFKAISKELTERYENAKHLADDLQRYLEDRPILAHPPTVVEKARKWARRHVVALSGALLFAVLATAILALSMTFVIRARDAARIAEQERSLEAQNAIRDRNEAQRLQVVADEQRAEAERHKNHADENFERALEIVQFAVSPMQNPLVEEAKKAGGVQAESLRILQQKATQFLDGMIVEGSPDPLVRRETALAKAHLVEIFPEVAPQEAEVRAKYEQMLERAIRDLIAVRGVLPDDPTVLFALARVRYWQGVYFYSSHLRDREDRDLLAKARLVFDAAIADFEESERRFPNANIDYYYMANAYRHRLSTYGVSISVPAGESLTRAEWERHVAANQRMIKEQRQAAAHDWERAARCHLRNVAREAVGIRSPHQSKTPPLREACFALIEAGCAQDQAENPGRGLELLQQAIDLTAERPIADCFPQVARAYQEKRRIHLKLGDEEQVGRDWDDLLASLDRARSELGRDPTKDIAARARVNSLERPVEWLAGELARQYSTLAGILRPGEREGDREDALRKAYAIWEHACDAGGEGPEMEALKNAGREYASFLVSHRRHREAIPVLQRSHAMEIQWRATLAKSDSEKRHDPGIILDLLRVCFVTTGRRVEALDTARRSVQLWREHFHAHGTYDAHWNFVQRIHFLAALEDDRRSKGLHYEEAVREAEDLLEKQVAIQVTMGQKATFNSAVLSTVGLCKMLLARAAHLSSTGETSEAGEDLLRADQLLASVAPTFTQHRFPSAFRNPFSPCANDLAWALATHPDPEIRDPLRAAELARLALQNSPEDRGIWNTRGVADYRCWNLGGALEALNKSVEMSSGGSAEDWLFLAMTHWQLGNAREAREWFSKAAAWLQENPLPGDEITRFHAEAAALFAQGDCSASPPPPSLPEP